MEEKIAIEEDKLNKLKQKLRSEITKDRVLRWAKIYNLLQWKWAHSDSKSNRVPRTDQIYDHVIHLIDSLEPGHDNFFVESGGFRVEYRVDCITDSKIYWDGTVKFNDGFTKVL